MKLSRINLLDILGNVFEWTADEGPPPFELAQGTPFFVAKGGSWNSGEETRLCSRFLFKAGFTSNLIGFRCVTD